MSLAQSTAQVRTTQLGDYEQIRQLCLAVYPFALPWNQDQIRSHLHIFPEGQFVAIDEESGKVVGMASSLVVRWDEYEFSGNWIDFTDHGYFTNHDPENGHTLYGAEVMVHPDFRGRGIGKKLYRARRELAQRLGLWRIRAGARLRGYHHYVVAMSAKEYVDKVISGELADPTLTFQLRQGFRVLAVVQGYLRHDPESLGWAAVIEWKNPESDLP